MAIERQVSTSPDDEPAAGGAVAKPNGRSSNDLSTLQRSWLFRNEKPQVFGFLDSLLSDSADGKLDEGRWRSWKQARVNVLLEYRFFGGRSPTPDLQRGDKDESPWTDGKIPQKLQEVSIDIRSAILY
jgi:hypothetical protein